MKKNKKIILYYVVSNKHIENCLLLKKKLINYEFIILYDKVLNKKKINKLNNEYYELNNKFYDLIYKLKNKIHVCIASTAQFRKDPLNLFYHLYINNIPIMGLQETHQFYLHNNELNNYLLPMNKILVNSNFEKNKFLEFNYSHETIEVIGWSGVYKNSKEKLNQNNIVLIILNASNNINPISNETSNIQLDFIDKIYNFIGNKYKLVVKLHPAESSNYYYFIKKKINKKINIYTNEYKISDLILNSNLIFCSGYTESFLEAIFLNKKIILYEIEKSNNLIKDYKNLFSNFDSINNILNNYDYRSSKDIYDINDLKINNTHYYSNFLNQISYNNNTEFRKTICNNLIELSIWFHYHGDEIKSINILNRILLNYKTNNTKIINYLLEIFNNNYNEDHIYKLFLNYENINIFFVLKYIVIKKFYKYDLINKKFDKFLSQIDPKYLSNTFFYDNQFFLNVLLFKNKFKLFNILQKNHYKNNYKIYMSKSFLYRFYLFLRNKTFYINYFPLFKNINIFISNKFIN